MNERETKLVARIAADSRVRFIAELTAGRVAIEIPVALIKTHADLAALRGGDPWSVKDLSASIRETGEDSLYPISLYCDADAAGELIYYCGDGAQRLRALIANSAERTAAQVVVRWRDLKDAMGESFAANYHRLAWSEQDVFSIIRSKVLSPELLKRYTGFSDSTYERYACVAPHEWLVQIVKHKCLGYAKAASLVKSCRSSVPKLKALERALVELFDFARENAEYYRDSAKRTKLKNQDKDKVNLSYWFKSKSNRLGEITDAINADDDQGLAQDENGNWSVPEGLGAKLQEGAVIGPESEWDTSLALSNFFGRKADEIPLDSFEEVLERWDDIRQKLAWHRDRIRDREYRASIPLPSAAKKADPEPPRRGAKKQRPDSIIE